MAVLKDLNRLVVIPIMDYVLKHVCVAASGHRFQNVHSDELAPMSDIVLCHFPPCRLDHGGKVIEYAPDVWLCFENCGEQRSKAATEIHERAKRGEVVAVQYGSDLRTREVGHGLIAESCL